MAKSNPYPPTRIYGEPHCDYGEKMLSILWDPSEAKDGTLLAVYEFKEFVRVHRETSIAPATPAEIDAYLTKVEQESKIEEPPF